LLLPLVDIGAVQIEGNAPERRRRSTKVQIDVDARRPQLAQVLICLNDLNDRSWQRRRRRVHRAAHDVRGFEQIEIRKELSSASAPMVFVLLIFQ
jgi:hypothetical protein